MRPAPCRPCRIPVSHGGRTANPPHEYIRGGTTKILTLFHPASGQVRLQPVACCPNAVLHPWLRERLSEILAERPAPATCDPMECPAMESKPPAFCLYDPHTGGESHRCGTRNGNGRIP